MLIPRHADNSGNHADLRPIKICHSTILRLNSIWNSSLFQNMKCPSWTQVKWQKWSSDRTENGKCTNVMNRRSRVGQSTPILHRWFATRRLLIAWHICGRWYVIISLGHSCVEAQEINANRVLRRRILTLQHTNSGVNKALEPPSTSSVLNSFPVSGDTLWRTLSNQKADLLFFSWNFFCHCVIRT